MRRARIVCMVHASALAAALAVGGEREATAYSSATHFGPVYRDRWLVCHDEPSAPAPPPPRAPKVDPFGLVPVPRAAAPAPFDIVPHQADDVSTTEPLPARAAGDPVAPPPPVVVMREPRNSYLCLGFHRGRAGIARVLQAPPGARFYGHDSEDWLTTNADAAAIANVTEAIPGLRRTFDRPHPRTVRTGLDMTRTSLRASAAGALAEVGDKEYSPKIAAFLGELEAIPNLHAWRETFYALGRNDPDEASRYAIDALERHAAGPRDAARTHEIYKVLPWILDKHRGRALPVLQRLSSGTNSPDHEECLVLGARARLGDAALFRAHRAAMEGSLDTNVATVCYSQLVAGMYPGKDASEIPVLIHRGRYHEIVLLTAALAADPSAKAAAARRDLGARLDKLADRPSLTAGRGDNRFVPTDRARWLAVRAKLGDARALADLWASVDDATDASDAPWVGAWAGLTLDLPGAVEHAKTRLQLGIKLHTSVAETDHERGGIVVTWRVRVLELLAARAAPAVGLGLLQEDHFAREYALYALSRHRDLPVCDLVLDAAKDAPSGTIDSALWSLTTLGDACRFSAERVARDKNQPPHLRGMATELLAMLRAPTTRAAADAFSKEGQRQPTERASLQRVDVILRSPE